MYLFIFENVKIKSNEKINRNYKASATWFSTLAIKYSTYYNENVL